MVDSFLVMMTKPSEPGRVKTRMTPALSPEEAALGHRSFLDALSVLVSSFCSASPLRKFVLSVSGDEEHDSLETLREQADFLLDQGSGGLGQRLLFVSDAAFALSESVDSLLFIGSDSPTLPLSFLIDAEILLKERRADVVIVPALDGGYCMIGFCRGAQDVLFGGEIPWSTEGVLKATLRACRAADLRVRLLPFWYDVDNFSDLELLRDHVLSTNLANGEVEQYTAVIHWLEGLCSRSILPFP